MGKLWFTSDTHFGSERTLTLSKRPFDNVKEMDDTIVSNWNSIIKEGDTIVHVGDFGEYEVAERLNGNILLVMGNYEERDHKENRNLFEKRLKSSGIKLVASSFPYIIKCKGEMTMAATHKPLNAKNYFEHYGYDFTLFGHIHKLQMVKKYGLNVGIDCHNFFPIDMDTVLFYKNAIENHYDRNVFE